MSDEERGLIEAIRARRVPPGQLERCLLGLLGLAGVVWAAMLLWRLARLFGLSPA